MKISEVKELANNGDAEMCLKLGNHYLEKENRTGQEFLEALDWYEKGAKCKYPSQECIGRFIKLVSEILADQKDDNVIKFYVPRYLGVAPDNNVLRNCTYLPPEYIESQINFGRFYFIQLFTMALYRENKMNLRSSDIELWYEIMRHEVTYDTESFEKTEMLNALEGLITSLFDEDKAKSNFADMIKNFTHTYSNHEVRIIKEALIRYVELLTKDPSNANAISDVIAIKVFDDFEYHTFSVLEKFLVNDELEAAREYKYFRELSELPADMSEKIAPFFIEITKKYIRYLRKTKGFDYSYKRYQEILTICSKYLDTLCNELALDYKRYR